MFKTWVDAIISYPHEHPSGFHHKNQIGGQRPTKAFPRPLKEGHSHGRHIIIKREGFGASNFFLL